MNLDVFCHVYVLLDVCFAVIYAVYNFWVSFCAVDPLHSLVLFSRSMPNTTDCFTVPLHNMTRTATNLDCFTVCSWTGMNLSLGLFTVTFAVVRLHSILFFISLTPSYVYVHIFYMEILSSRVFLVENSFPLRRPPVIRSWMFKFFTRSEALWRIN